MEERLVGFVTSNDKNWDKRWKYNCAIFIISYIFMGAVTGITNDSYISYLNLTVPDVVKALPMYTSIGTFIMAMMLLLVHKLGYKKIIVFAPVVLIGALLSCIYSSNGKVILVANILVNVGAGLFDFIYPLMFTSYTPKEKRISMFSRVMYCNLISQSILTFLNGKIVVWKFSKYLGISYDKASALSENASKLTSTQMSYYINSYEFALWIAIVFAVLALGCLFFLREKVEDYRETEEEIAARKAENKFSLKVFCNKYIIMWVVIFSTIRFGALLITPYFPIYLNNFLHISRGTVSTIITFQTVAMVLGFLAAPYLEKKLGSIVTISLSMILCIPLMLIMANGTIFGGNIAWIIGSVLFLRSGLANASNPIQQSLPLTFVPKNLAPAYSSVILISNSIVGIFAGLFARYSLLKTDTGYGKAYYIASTLYFIASVVLLIVFIKKYNRGLSEEEIKINEVKEEFIEEK
ncbi:MFS transporter [Paraclostridium bifermentans]|uniref:MFS transporter n=1 Tax=Paraclostridium TaxID=1849822 RepID=UPI001CC63903|nr:MULTISPECIES: MFS transporter [Paraclostridium]MBZ6006439.1 MFS transporter [Paraclostridium bifermentans]MDU0298161.1 MFS transporter [Paraclostridium sp. MRS3W1]